MHKEFVIAPKNVSIVPIYCRSVLRLWLIKPLVEYKGFQCVCPIQFASVEILGPFMFFSLLVTNFGLKSRFTLQSKSLEPKKNSAKSNFFSCCSFAFKNKKWYYIVPVTFFFNFPKGFLFWTVKPFQLKTSWAIATSFSTQKKTTLSSWVELHCLFVFFKRLSFAWIFALGGKLNFFGGGRLVDE